jgi:hypothetical protein
MGICRFPVATERGDSLNCSALGTEPRSVKGVGEMKVLVAHQFDEQGCNGILKGVGEHARPNSATPLSK